MVFSEQRINNHGNLDNNKNGKANYIRGMCMRWFFKTGGPRFIPPAPSSLGERQQPKKIKEKKNSSTTTMPQSRNMRGSCWMPLMPIPQSLTMPPPPSTLLPICSTNLLSRRHCGFHSILVKLFSSRLSLNKDIVLYVNCAWESAF